MSENLPCKICKSNKLDVFEHTAKCKQCGVLLYYPYPIGDDDQILESIKNWDREGALRWYESSSFLNHVNFTNMLRFTIDKSNHGLNMDILDYGGGGGQFALVCKSHFPLSNIFITDIADHALLDEWRPINKQILFKDFEKDEKKFDFIFMNDVYEHVSDPIAVLKLLSGKLKPGGKIFIDTPKQFWIYPLARFLSTLLYKKILRGTVSTMHLQIWTKNSFKHAVRTSDLSIVKYKELSEYTMPPSFYLNNMGVKNQLIRLLGYIFYKYSKVLAKNKIMSILESDHFNRR